VALNATGVQVGRVADCSHGFHADAAVRFTGAQVACSTSAAAGWPVRTRARRVPAAGAGAGPEFAEPPGGTVNVATAGRHPAGRAESWPRAMRLDGLVYGRCVPAAPRATLGWLRRAEPGYLPQPFRAAGSHLPWLRRRPRRPVVHLAQQRGVGPPAVAGAGLGLAAGRHGRLRLPAQPRGAVAAALLVIGTAFFQARIRASPGSAAAGVQPVPVHPGPAAPIIA